MCPEQQQQRRRRTQQVSNGLKILLVLVIAVVALLSLESLPSLFDTTTESNSNDVIETAADETVADETKAINTQQRKSTSKTKKKKPSKSSTSKSKSKTTTKTTTTSFISSKGIRQISILGERNSGTRWTWDHVSSCFNYSIPVVKELTRYKHWFQYPNATLYPHDTLVLAQFRNPFDWLKAMQHVPHHAPMHYNLTWKEFLTKPWTMPRVGSDLQITDPLTPCQEDFVYKDIVSCAVEPLPKEAYDHVLRYSEHQPFYEMNMDGSGRPYENIMQFRSDKILNMLSVREYPGVRDVWVLQYEYLLAKGTAHLLQMLEEHTGIPPKCNAFPRQYRPSRPVTKAFAKYVNRHLNWTTEALIGYATDEKREEKWD